MTNETDGRHFSEACERNKAPILEVLKRVLPEEGLVLEIGSGTGRHAAHFAPRLPGITWQPSDRDPDSFASIDAWARQEAGSGESATGNQQEAPGEAARPGVPPENKRTPNLLPPIVLDVTGAVWPITEADAIFSANMIHIAPWECCLGLVAGAGRILAARGPGGLGVSPGNKTGKQTTTGGALVLYGPFKREGEHTAPSNESFDHSLRARDPAWGVRDLDAVADAAAGAGLDLAETVGMPANNLIAVFRRRG
ncbi:MAG: DUF938 domain-containing protein [Proteobacteria bacterium]|nr:DUF938 domain-containing protein [Pseudomonadota bacterium]